MASNSPSSNMSKTSSPSPAPSTPQSTTVDPLFDFLLDFPQIHFSTSPTPNFSISDPIPHQFNIDNLQLLSSSQKLNSNLPLNDFQDSSIYGISKNHLKDVFFKTFANCPVPLTPKIIALKMNKILQSAYKYSLKRLAYKYGLVQVCVQQCSKVYAKQSEMIQYMKYSTESASSVLAGTNPVQFHSRLRNSTPQPNVDEASNYYQTLITRIPVSYHPRLWSSKDAHLLTTGILRVVQMHIFERQMLAQDPNFAKYDVKNLSLSDPIVHKITQEPSFDWISVHRFSPDRTLFENQHAWFNFFSPQVKKYNPRLTKAEKAALSITVQYYQGHYWDSVTRIMNQKFKTKRPMWHYFQYNQQNIDEFIENTDEFTEEEDFLLMDLVANYGTQQWGTICQHIPSRTAQQCKERFLFKLAPSINRLPWTSFEDMMLVCAYNLVGLNPMAISKFLVGRCDIQCEERLNLLLPYKPGVPRRKPECGYQHAIISQIDDDSLQQKLLSSTSKRFIRIDTFRKYYLFFHRLFVPNSLANQVFDSYRPRFESNFQHDDSQDDDELSK